MALPKVANATYEIQLYSIEQPVSFRAYTVKEEKVLLIAMESKSEKEIASALQSVVSACVLDDIDIKNLPSFDLEHLFIAIRGKSVSEVSEFKMRFDSCPEETRCMKEVELDLRNVKLEIPENHTRRIMITDKIGIIMRYPTIKLLEKIKASNGQIEAIIDIIGKCIESVIDGKKTIPADTVKFEEIRTFIESLSRTQFKKIAEFFDTMPKLKATVTTKCEKCNKELSQTVEGMANFFS